MGNEVGSIKIGDDKITINVGGITISFLFG